MLRDTVGCRTATQVHIVYCSFKASECQLHRIRHRELLGVSIRVAKHANCTGK